jgi:hypothetical protein
MYFMCYGASVTVPKKVTTALKSRMSIVPFFVTSPRMEVLGVLPKFATTILKSMMSTFRSPFASPRTAGSGVGCVTVTVTLRVVVPPGPVAVSVYAVVVVGITVAVVPLTAPTPESIETVMAPDTFHESTVELPLTIEAGFAVNDAMTGAGVDVGVAIGAHAVLLHPESVASSTLASIPFAVTIEDDICTVAHT